MAGFSTFVPVYILLCVTHLCVLLFLVCNSSLRVTPPFKCLFPLVFVRLIPSLPLDFNNPPQNIPLSQCSFLSMYFPLNVFSSHVFFSQYFSFSIFSPLHVLPSSCIFFFIIFSLSISSSLSVLPSKYSPYAIFDIHILKASQIC